MAVRPFGSELPVGDGDELRRHAGRSTVPTHSLKAAHCSSRCWQGIVTGRGTLLPAAALSGSCSLRQSRSFVSPRKPCYLCTCRRKIRTIGFTYENEDVHHRGSLSLRSHERRVGKECFSK